MTAKGNAVVELSRPGWSEAVLVCSDCRKRRNGPSGMKRKAVLGELKKALRYAKPRPRVVSTGCLGPCPKGAMTIAFVGAAGGARHCEVGSLQQVAAAAGLMAASAPVGGDGAD